MTHGAQPQSCTQHPAVQYRALDGLPGRYFDCGPLRATVLVQACAQRWRSAQHESGATCTNCPVGASHAGAAPSAVAAAAPTFCLRCGNTGMRLLRRSICISCFNREREWLLGRNRKGFPPRAEKAVFLWKVRAGGSVRSVLARDPAEAVMAAFRLFGDGASVFCASAAAASQSHVIPQMELF